MITQKTLTACTKDVMVAMTRSRTAFTKILSEKSSRSKKKVAAAATSTTKVWTKALTAWNWVRRRRTRTTEAELRLPSPWWTDRRSQATS